MRHPSSNNMSRRTAVLMSASVARHGFGLGRHVLLIMGFLIGGGLGLTFYFYAPDAPFLPALLTWLVRPIEQVFLGALFVLIVPLLFSSIVSGIARLRGDTGVQGLVTKAFGYMLAVCATAALIGLSMANLFRPGDAIPHAVGSALLTKSLPHLPYGVGSHIPTFDSANGALMLMVIASFIIGGTLPLLRKRNRQQLVSGCERLFAAGMNVLSWVTRFAPIAVACFMFDMTVMFGWDLLLSLSAYIMVVLAALAMQVVITFFIMVWMLGDFAPGTFLHRAQASALIAFSTSSSNAALPSALRTAEHDLRLPGPIVRPVLGLGTVSNQSGTTIYIAVTVLFVSQFFGIELHLERQALVFAIATLAGMGTVGVPAGALPTLATVLAIAGLPPEGVGLVIGIDRLLDMFRTLVNVVGDLAVAVALSKEPASVALDISKPLHESE